MSKVPPTKLLVIAIIISFGGSFHFGYQLVITNPSQAAFIKFLNASNIAHYGVSLTESEAKTIWSIIVAVMFAGAICGSLSIGFFSVKFGRKRGLYVSVGLSIFSVLLAIISYHANSYELYIVSRIILGFAIALSLGLAAVFFNESSPKQCRGFVSMMTGTMVQVGTFVGAVIATPLLFGTTDRWWYIYLTEMIILCIVMVILPFIPESPAYLSQKGDDIAAKQAIRFFYSCKIGAADAPLNEIKENIRLSASKMSVIAVFKDHYSRKGVIIGVIIAFAMSFSGIAVINAFAVELLKNSGLSTQDASYGNIGLCGVSVISSVIASVVVDRFGRRPLVLFSLAVLFVLNIIIFVLMFCFNEFQLRWVGYLLIVIISLFLFFFAIGVGPLSFFVATEMVGQAARATSQSFASLTQMACRLIILLIFYPISNAIGQAITYLILFVVPVIASFFFLYSKMPETKNKDHMAVIAVMDKLPPLTRCCKNKKFLDHLKVRAKFEGETSYIVERF